MVLGLASCQQDFDAPVQVSGEVDFQLSVAAPEIAGTRAGDEADKPQNALNSAYGAIDYLQGGTANDGLRTDWSDVDLRYTLEVYDVDEEGNVTNLTPVKDRMVMIVDEYKPVTFDLRLVPNRKYRFVVFADFVGNGNAMEKAAVADIAAQTLLDKYYTIGETLQDIKVIDTADAINDECTDAYFATKDITIENSAAQDMQLKRPFGKVRVIATDLAELNINVDPAKVEVTYTTTVPNMFNALTGEIAAAEETKQYFVDEYNKISKLDLSNHYYTEDYDAKKATNANGVERHTHMTLFTDYILATAEQTPFQFTMTVWDQNKGKIKETLFNTDIPVERNKLTTIIGNVLTTATEINITIDDNFSNGVYDAPYYNELWDGKTITEPACENDVYTIKVPSELAWLAQEVNKGRDFKGATFNVVANLDLNNEPWTPIGHGEYFRGTFNGNNHTIANLFYHNTDTNDWLVGLFGLVDNATIKDINFVDANVYAAGGWAAALVGAVSGNTTIENINVSGLVQIEGKMDYDQAGYIGVIVGGDLDGSHVTNINNITIDVDEDSYVKGNQFIGGVVGQTNNVTNLSNIESNIDVIAQEGIVGGIVASLQHNSVVTNCVCSGDVTRVTAEGKTENQYKRIGAIAGTWESTVGKVVFTDVEYTGTLNAGNDMTTFDYAGYVGRDLNTKDSATGRIFINGCEWVAYNKIYAPSADVLNDALSYFNGVDIVVTGEINTNGNAIETFGKNVNIDMNNQKSTSGSAANYGFNAKEASTVVIDNANMTSNGGGIGVVGGSHVTFNGGTIYVDSPSTSGRYVFYVASNSTCVINDGNFSWDKNDNAKRAYIYTTAGSKVVVNGGEFGKASSRADYAAGIMGEGEVVIYGGIFGFDPSNWVADGYSAVKNGSKWYVVEGNAETKVVATAEALNTAIADAQEGETIYLANGTYAGLFDLDGKNVNIAAAGNNVVVNGLIWLNNTTSTISGIKMTNTEGVQHPNPSDSKYYSEINGKYPLVGAYLNTNVSFENCTFDLVGPTTYGFYGYATINPVFVGCTFNCNKIRPIANNGTNVTVDGCTFIDQYHYSVRIFENAGERMNVVFTNNTIKGSNDKGEFEGINISKKGGSATVFADFTIEGNTNVKYRYHKNVTLDASCTGANLFEREE